MPQHASAEGRTTQGKSIALFLRDILVIFVIAVLISFLVKTFLIRPFFIPSESMNQTLQVDDRVIVSLLTPEVIPLERGDVVVFEDPDNWLGDPPPAPEPGFFAGVDWFLTFIGLAPEDDHGYLIKRIIGLPGDTVACCNDFGQLTVNGIPIDEPYVVAGEGMPASGIDFSVTVPEGHVWVMGDNRYHSADSRAHMDSPGGGFVPIRDVVGRAVLISWPLDRWSWIDNYDSLWQGVGDTTSAP